MPAPSNDIRKFIPVIAILIVAAVLHFRDRKNTNAPVATNNSSPAAGPGEYLFCTWNVENLFDDQRDKRNQTDEEYDRWFAEKPDDLHLKLSHLAEALAKMNGGKGPDILVAIEVESKRAAQLLTEAMNKALPEGAAPYSTVIMKEISAGRHIAPAIISRLPVSSEHEPRILQPQRILIANLVAAGHELTIFATHWTSRRTDGEGSKREKYADLVYGRANEIYHSNPNADILVCGDFNDTPDDSAVRNDLRAGCDVSGVRSARELRFLDLMCGKNAADYGTIYYGGKPLIYDHICVAPGLLDNVGWSCDIDSIRTITDGLVRPGSRHREPWRFGDPKHDAKRGFSDHFPVTVKLRVNES
jgi:endonuclease/exonuclease/phosphatase family metal-dependent hydrolase